MEWARVGDQCSIRRCIAPRLHHSVLVEEKTALPTLADCLTPWILVDSLAGMPASEAIQSLLAEGEGAAEGRRGGEKKGLARMAEEEREEVCV